MSAHDYSNPLPMLKVAKEVLAIFSQYRQVEAADKEACGLLIGTHSVNGKRINLEHATNPTSRDTRTRFGFLLRDPAHCDQLEQHFRASGREKVLLGTWHTHPEPIPSPSLTDRKDWQKQFCLNEKLFGRMVFVIVGTDCARFWLLERSRFSLIHEIQVFGPDGMEVCFLSSGGV